MFLQDNEIETIMLVMKKMLSRFFIIFALVLTSINICLPGDVDCSDIAGVSLSSSIAKTTNPFSTQSDHHCSGLPCFILMIGFLNEEIKSSVAIISQLSFFYKLSNYPEVSILTDKPPAI